MGAKAIRFEGCVPIIDRTKLPSGLPVRIMDHLVTTGQKRIVTISTNFRTLRLTDRIKTLERFGLHEIVVNCGDYEEHAWTFRPYPFDPCRRCAVDVEWKRSGEYILVQVRSEIDLPKGRLVYRVGDRPIYFDIGCIRKDEPYCCSFWSAEMSPTFKIDDSVLPPREAVEPQRYAKLGLGIKLNVTHIEQ